MVAMRIRCSTQGCRVARTRQVDASRSSSSRRLAIVVKSTPRDASSSRRRPGKGAKRGAVGRPCLVRPDAYGREGAPGAAHGPALARQHVERVLENTTAALYVVARVAPAPGKSLGR